MKTLIIAMLCFLPLVVNAQVPAELTISGKASTEVTPDITVINLNLSAEDKSYSTSVDLLQGKADEIKSFLKKKGISKDFIKSENFNITKSYVYENRKQIFKGYKATLNINIEILNDNALANKVINSIGESNSDASINIYHKLSQELKDSVNDQLIEAAIKDAKKKAEIIARATDQQLGHITKINYGVEENISISPRAEVAFMAMDSEMKNSSDNSLSITPQPIEKSTDIIIYWLMK